MNNNIPIIELAQLLTGALDENFNIKNQSAVIKVVSCLEAFKITHESYREVQNTRLIKDLQALRQNKANDQVLAKRIKNLLRKWKERLASSVVATASHPNSPQNFSQGNSSDATIFMTQQSQSPPNNCSLPSQQPPPRLINGPTTFKDLIPKRPSSAVTSPAIPHHQQQQQQQNHHYNNNYTNNNNSHIHQNGGFIESSSSSMPPTLLQSATGPSLLGKRKFLAEGNGNGNNDIDENSNHSNGNRRKMMKKSTGTAFGQISSPNIPVPPPSSAVVVNNNLYNNINNNSNSNNSFGVNNIKPVPVLQLQQQQKQPTPPLMPAATTALITTPPSLQEAPKKRGRRKGSKGIDSTLNGSSIPTDFTTEIEQKIALSAGKRNKTTFELQKMLTESHQQNQLLNINGDSVDSTSLDRVSLNANAASSSHHFPQQQQQQKSSSIENKKIKTEVKIEFADDDQKSLQQFPSSSLAGPSNQLASSTLRSLTIEDEIAQLESLLPPIDYEAAARDIFSDLDTVDEHGDVIECTCTFREVITYSDEIEQANANVDAGSGGVGGDGSEKVGNLNEVKINGDSAKHSSELMSEEDDDDDDETDDFCAVEDIVERSPPPVRSAVKSIFDPEYDANENLIEEMVRSRKLMRDIPKVIEVKIEKNAVKSSRIETLMNNIVPETVVSQPPANAERVPIINYVCDEDPMCPARAHFQRDPVTINDVNRLHNTFESGINGYFNGILEEPETHDFSKDIDGIDYAKHQLWKRVVPRYNFLTLDQVPKVFDDDSPLSMPPLPPPDIEIKEEKLEGSAAANKNIDNKFAKLTSRRDLEFREWHQTMNVRSYKDEILTILPYVVID